MSQPVESAGAVTIHVRSPGCANDRSAPGAVSKDTLSGITSSVFNIILELSPDSTLAVRETSRRLMQNGNFFLRWNMGEIVRLCSDANTPLGSLISRNFHSARNRVSDLPDRNMADRIAAMAFHVLLPTTIRSFGASGPACPLRVLTAPEIHPYNSRIEDDNLERVWHETDASWGGLRLPVWRANPGLAGFPARDASTQVVRTWIQANQTLLQGITRLRLDNRHLTWVPREIGLCTHLLELRLDGNQLSSLPPGLLQKMPALQQLSLFHNQIESLPEPIFQGMAALQDLNLGWNRLDSAPERLLRGLTALQSVNFGMNQIPSLPAGLFQGLPSLCHLYLWGNRLSSLPEGIFQDLAALNELCLQNNQLVSLPRDLFWGTPTLWEHRFFDNPRLLPFYTDLTRHQNNIDPLRRVMHEFFNYEPESPFARFYRLAGGGASDEAVRGAFAALPNPIKNAIYKKVWVEAGCPQNGDPQWGCTHAFDDMQIFYGALKRYVREGFEALDEGKKNTVYRHVYLLARGQRDAGTIDFSDPEWGKNHACDNILRLIDAMDAAGY